jgi:hypothetical protein
MHLTDFHVESENFRGIVKVILGKFPRAKKICLPFRNISLYSKTIPVNLLYLYNVSNVLFLIFS